MNKKEALEEVKGLKGDLEKILDKAAGLLPKCVKHKHMFNDISCVLNDVKYSIDQMAELEGEIEGKDDEEKKAAFMAYGMPEAVEKVEYDFEWDSEDEGDDEEDKKDKEDKD